VTLPRKEFLALLRQIVVVKGGKDVTNSPEGVSANEPKTGRSKLRVVPGNDTES
jgi:hypothetical protein